MQGGVLEQARGHDVDIRADIFALGAIAYRALCGQGPFPGAYALHVVKLILNDSPAAPSSLARLSEQVDHVFALALAHDPGERFARHGELARAMRGAAAGRLPGDLERRARRLIARRPWRRDRGVG